MAVNCAITVVCRAIVSPSLLPHPTLLLCCQMGPPTPGPLSGLLTFAAGPSKGGPSGFDPPRPVRKTSFGGTLCVGESFFFFLLLSLFLSFPLSLSLSLSSLLSLSCPLTLILQSQSPSPTQ